LFRYSGSYATIHEIYGSTRAIRILSLMVSVSVLAPAFGPLLGGLVLKVGSWRNIFWDFNHFRRYSAAFVIKMDA